VVFYVHPWELDENHPRIRFPWKPRLTHYFNLGSTLPKLRSLLRGFEFGPIGRLSCVEDALSRSVGKWASTR
jgi:hypothetical protein